MINCCRKQMSCFQLSCNCHSIVLMLQEVSKDFKSTLEREIGIDEVVSPRNYINKSALYADEKQETVVDPSK